MAALTQTLKGTRYPGQSSPGVVSTLPVTETVDEERAASRPDLLSEHTRPEVTDKEKGEEKTSDTGESCSKSVGISSISLRNIVRRKELAAELEVLANRVGQSRGKAIMAAHLQALRSRLSRSHQVLREMYSEANYRSIVTLVESTLQTMDWKTATNDQCRRVVKTLAVGTKSARVTYDDYLAEVKLMASFSIPSLPTFQLGDEEEDHIDPE